MKNLLWILLLINVCSFAATIYSNTDKNGNITYSDIPLRNSKLVVIPESSSVIASPANNNSSNATNNSILPTVAEGYTKFLVESPKDQETLQNTREFPVNLTIEPSLKKGHKVLLFIDGRPYGDAIASTQVPVGQLDRGSHQISAQLLDETKKVLKQTATITVYMLYSNLNSPKRQVNGSQ